MTVDAKSGGAQCFQGLPLFRECALSLHQGEVGVEVQTALGHDIRVEGANRSCRRISGIDCRREPLLFALLIQP